ncbi:MAG: rod shape-determining protein RodA [Treponema sp.]|nr:rod shape-determining protein RodA [Treponema sp.]
MKGKLYQFFDYVLILCVTVLVTFGVLFIYSSGINSEGVNVSREYIKQIIWASIGMLLMLGCALYDFRRLARYAPMLFGFLVVILVYTRIFGRYVNGARSWIGFGGFGVQPSEFCKIFFILFLAWYFERSQQEDSRRRFVIASCIMMIPFGLILVQPDMGTASVYFPIFLVMCFVAGIPLRYILYLLIGGMLTLVFTVLPIWQTEIAKHTFRILNMLTVQKLRLLLIFGSGAIAMLGMFGWFFFRHNKYYYWIAYAFSILCGALILSKMAAHILKDYQIQRLIVFLDPYTDAQGSGWNIIQSKIAIGSGGIFGRGYLQGTQSHYRFLPQQSTDFIFSILSEEFGLIGGLTVFTLYLIILLRTIMIIKQTNNTYGYFIASGILGMFFYHFIVNVGMVMGIMPITGIPLLFLSYGGSSLWTAMICMGLLMSIRYRKLDFDIV